MVLFVYCIFIAIATGLLMKIITDYRHGEAFITSNMVFYGLQVALGGLCLFVISLYRKAKKQEEFLEVIVNGQRQGDLRGAISWYLSRETTFQLLRSMRSLRSLR